MAILVMRMECIVGRHSRPSAVDDAPATDTWPSDADWTADFVWESETPGTSRAVSESDGALAPTPPPWFRG
ncbi:hypothetical protein [Mycobacteroides salmoniphilum]|uniref:Uncharacterized protein n=1 Tax=Mycobacteroides salmoniphilum TaxID=404941 RepID=A0A4R8SWZ7_9MYCO|nr:hypothetical protein [Mycobacteroides salmoniphilum]TEA06899.1 hypothetical protein CCUG60884_02040 [Mycobacteroides salmoniphilum]